MQEKIYASITRFVTRHSKLIIFITILLVSVCSFFIAQLHFENDVTLWVDKNTTMGKLPHYINQRFGNNTPLLVAIDFDDLFTGGNLLLLKQFTDALESMDSIDEVISIANIDDVIPTAEGIRVEKLITYPFPDDPAYFAALKAHTLSQKSYVGSMVSRDGKTTLIVAKPDVERKSDLIAKDVKKTAGEIFKDSPAKLYYSGNPFLLNSIADIIIADFVFLIPMISLLLIGVLYLSFRSKRGIFLPLITVLFSAALTMGIMSITKTSLNILSSAVPVLLIAVGSAYGIHVLNNYYEHSRQMNDKGLIVGRGLREVGLPVLMAGLTTMVGFLSNITADVNPIRTFGVFTAIGVALAMLIALLFIPATLMHLKITRPKKKLIDEDEEVDTAAIKIPRFVKWLSNIVIGHKKATILVFGVITVLVAVFSVRIATKVDILGYFSKTSEPRLASNFINDRFGGFNPLNIYMKADMQNPDILKCSLMLGEHIKAYGNVSSPNGVADMIAELNYAMTGRYTIPETQGEVSNLWFFIEGRKAVESTVTPEKDEGLITVLLPNLDNEFVGALFTHLNGFINSCKKGIAVVANTPGNPYSTGLVRTMLENALRDHAIAYNKADIDALVPKLTTLASAGGRGMDKEALFAYCTGDEAELLLSTARTALLLEKLADAPALDSGSIAAILTSLLTAADAAADEDTAALAVSLAALIKEYQTGQKLSAFIAEVKTQFPAAAITDKELNYVLAPLLWETIPVPQQARETGTTDVVRNAQFEKLELTGMAYLIEDIRKNIFTNQISSLLLALIAVLILNWITFGSLLEGVISLVAIIFTIMMNFGIMGIFNIPLDFVTAIIGSVAIGTGIDYTIHFIIRYTRELKRNQDNIALAYEITLATTGKAVMFNALSVGLGFAILLFSNVVPLRTAGLLLAITMATSSIAALTFLPAVLAATKIIQRRLAK